jgi:hypothetical protein
MHHLLRSVLALITAAWLMSPAPGNGGGENNGGTGVWILPACANITAAAQDPAAAARMTIQVPGTASDVRLQVDSSMGVASAVFVDDLSGAVIGMPVAGRLVTLPRQLLQALQHSPIGKGTLMITDASQMGYVIRVVAMADGSVSLAVR